MFLSGFSHRVRSTSRLNGFTTMRYSRRLTVTSAIIAGLRTRLARMQLSTLAHMVQWNGCRGRRLGSLRPAIRTSAWGVCRTFISITSELREKVFRRSAVRQLLSSIICRPPWMMRVYMISFRTWMRRCGNIMLQNRRAQRRYRFCRSVSLNWRKMQT